MTKEQRLICDMAVDVGHHFDIDHWMFHYHVSAIYIYTLRSTYQFVFRDYFKYKYVLIFFVGE